MIQNHSLSITFRRFIHSYFDPNLAARSVQYRAFQASNAEQTIQGKDALKIQIDKEIEAHKVKIRNLELKKFSQQKGSFSDEELVKMLSAVGFEGKALKVAWAVVKKESNGRPLAFNGNVKTES
jgi:hypothetical protein